MWYGNPKQLCKLGGQLAVCYAANTLEIIPTKYDRSIYGAGKKPLSTFAR